ncbi:MAG: adenylyltransferase/cytidyltransferase family protein [Patescibacteria group bacterium]|nr:adenylyltransferase/cytidyltransferase family protein [Patescibacteria group bacterium]
MSKGYYLDKLVELIELEVILNQNIYKGNLAIACTTGAFDLLHPGHIGYIWRASQFCRHLVVGIDSDKRVKAAKGTHRPLFTERERAEVVAGIGCVDFVVIFDEMKEFLDIVAPQVLVVSPTSKEDKNFDRIGYAQSLGARVEQVPPQRELHTTDYVLRIISQSAQSNKSSD